MRVAILLPDPLLPFKDVPLTDAALARTRAPDVQALRGWWKTFAEGLARAIAAAGQHAAIVIEPMWRFTPEFVAALDAEAVVVPHRHAADFAAVRGKSLHFYMQVLCRWLFTCDPGGWSAAAADYPYDGYRAHPADPAVFDGYRARLIDGNASKFAQPPLGGTLPAPGYLFFPCQIPHDESILRFSRVEEAPLLRRLAQWADTRGIRLVCKEHPANRKAMAGLREATAGTSTTWVEASIHELIAGARAVVTINSGVGFEAMLHGKPVAVFGQVDYDAAAIRATPDDLDAMLATIDGEDPQRRIERYRRFIAWFTTCRAIDLESPSREAALARIAARILAAA